jgi:hypothetical protein
MRKGPSLNPELLCALVRDTGAKYRSDWSNAPFDLCYLPGLTNTHAAISFRDITTIPAEAAAKAQRLAIMSLYGVTLLIQRWIHFSCRLVVPTTSLADVFAGPFDEADLVEDAVANLVRTGWPVPDAEARVDQWLSGVSEESRISRRQRLNDPRQRSAVRREVRILVEDAEPTGS